ncbi:MAG: 30S ribosomal protein S7 [Candidatus Curtissbacteria bacterium]|nr:30S ribosomal protein S7 [Candidatus Curtissbacteria bacterium]
MPRTGKIIKRQVGADPIYNSPLVTKFINKVMKDGKKTIAEKAVYGAFAEIERKGEDPIVLFERALENITPKMEVKPRRVGGASYMVPIEVRGPRRQSLALTWLVDAARSRSPKDVEKIGKLPPIAAKIVAELQEAAQGAGKAVAKREEMHRMAEANKAFSHFRW